MAPKNEMLKKVYQAKSNKEVLAVYKEWAANYDTDAVENLGYVAHILTADAIDRVLKQKDAAILDAGCGTGLVGQELLKRGYYNLHALDYSREMLEESRRKDIYQRLSHADMNQPLDIQTDRYDAVVCCGSFSYGHINAGAFDELVRITRPGGIVCFTVREGAYDDCGYRDRLEKLEKEGAWKLIGVDDSDYLKNEGVACKLCIYRVLT